MLTRYTLSLFCAALVLPFSAFAIDNVGDCLISVEDFDHAIVEAHIPESTSAPLEDVLSEVVAACEAQNFPKAEQLLSRATDMYHRLIESGPHGITDADFWGLADLMWGNRSHLKGVDMMRVHLNDDTNGDMVGWRVNQDNPDGPFLQILGVVKTLDGQLQHAFVSLPFDTGEQYALCAMEGKINEISVRHETLSESEVQELMGDSASPHAIIIDDGMCDTIRLFWPKQVTQQETTFLLFRN